MADDRSLLDRLNALKPTTVGLDKEEPKPLLPVSSEPTSKVDALSARLRTLRNASASASPQSPRQGDTGAPLPAQPRGLDTPTRSASETKCLPSSSGPVRDSSPSHQAGDEEDDDPLFHGDDSTLDDLLESLDLDDDLSLDHPPVLPSKAKNDESKKVAALLEELGKPADAPLHDKDSPSEDDEETRVAALLEELGKPIRDPSQHDTDEDDNSDGEAMSAKIRDVLSRALDEAELDRSLHPEHHDREEEAQHTASASSPRPQPSSDPKDPFSLPTVPTHLSPPSTSPPPPPPSSKPLDFESQIAARMSRLSGISYGTSPTQTTFGLPSAPSFNPDTRSEQTQPQPPPGTFAGKLSSGGYTDEDQKSWCVVCLEDASVRCEGCDGDGYCERCWRDMHVGPGAGWDFRGHRGVRGAR